MAEIANTVEEMAQRKIGSEFLSNFQRLKVKQPWLKSYLYLEEINEEFLFNNYFNHWPMIGSLNGFSTDDKIEVLNFKIRHTNYVLSSKPEARLMNFPIKRSGNQKN